MLTSFRESAESIREGLDEIGLPDGVADAVMAGLDQGAFSDFNGAATAAPKTPNNHRPKTYFSI